VVGHLFFLERRLENRSVGPSGEYTTALGRCVARGRWGGVPRCGKRLVTSPVVVLTRAT